MFGVTRTFRAIMGRAIVLDRVYHRVVRRDSDPGHRHHLGAFLTMVLIMCVHVAAAQRLEGEATGDAAFGATVGIRSERAEAEDVGNLEGHQPSAVPDETFAGNESTLATHVLPEGGNSCCGEVASLRVRVEQLERSLSLLNDTLLARLDGSSACASGDASSHTDESMPDYYKLKDKAPERRWLDWRSWLYISFDVYAGDLYLGEFRQSMPWVRLVWDEMCFYDSKGQFHGQLYFAIFKWLLGAVPNPFLGERWVYLRLADGTVQLLGAKESLLHSLFSAERRSLDFTWSPSQAKFKSRKTVEVKGHQEWVFQLASGRGKAAEVKESVVHDIWGRQFRGWAVNILPGRHKLIHPIVPGYLAAFDLAEAEDNVALGMLLCLFGGALGIGTIITFR